MKLKNLEELIQKQWTDFFDHVKMTHKLLVDVRDSNYRVIYEKHIPNPQTKYSITNVEFISRCDDLYPNSLMEIWIEFSTPKNKGIVVGTHVYIVDLEGHFHLKESHGVLILTEEF